MTAPALPEVGGLNVETTDIETIEGPYYLYAIARAHPGIPTWPASTPVDGAGPVFTVTHGGLTAVLSGGSKERYPIARKNLVAHKAIVETVMATTPVLPVRFNTVAPSLEIVRRRLLTEKADELHAKLAAVEGRIELSVRATWTEQADVIARVMSENAELAALRDRLAQGASHNDRIRLGQMVEAAILRRRDALGKSLEDRLRALSEDAANGTLPDGVVANLSLLLPATGLEAVEAAVHAFDAEHDLLNIRIAGPLPPFTFSEMTVRWEDDPA